jgi:hypothetical protein
LELFAVVVAVADVLPQPPAVVALEPEVQVFVIVVVFIRAEGLFSIVVVTDGKGNLFSHSHNLIVVA